MLEVLCVILMLLVGAIHVWLGVFRAALTLINIVLAGFLAFNFFEPMAASWGGRSEGLDPRADALCILLVFVPVLTALMVTTSLLARRELTLPTWVRRIGGGVVGMLAGYLLSGIIICLFQTLPLSERFGGYDPDEGIGLGAPDRVWLAMMHRASGVVFDYPESRWFDADGSFIPRYARYRREGDQSPRPLLGEFPAVLDVRKTPWRELEKDGR